MKESLIQIEKNLHKNFNRVESDNDDEICALYEAICDILLVFIEACGDDIQDESDLENQM
jgi:hypothetical protein